MLINACDPIFKVGIQLDGDCISSENHSVDNLISPDAGLRKKGFLSERFIRPPVSLTVCFPFAFDIKYVVIGTRVGGQKSSGFQLFAGRGEDVRMICSLLTDKESIIFHNNNTDLSTFGNDYDKSCFYISASRNIRSAEKLTVRIFKTANSVPAIGKLEVWGSISYDVPREIRQALVYKWEESKTLKVKQVEITRAQPVNEKSTDIFKICDDFLDSITYEVMTCPMVLPGGKYIDRSTLEKCIEYDNTYGRLPCDPFTGIPFTDTQKPRPVPELKGRIDSFLIKHADHESVKYLPRTVGKRSINFYTERQAKVSKVMCSICDNSNNLYSLPCKHLRCRNCIQTDKIQCNICQKNFDRNQIVKQHEYI